LKKSSSYVLPILFQSLHLILCTLRII